MNSTGTIYYKGDSHAQAKPRARAASCKIQDAVYIFEHDGVYTVSDYDTGGRYIETVLYQKPTPEEAADAARVIVEYCDSRDCQSCPFYHYQHKRSGEWLDCRFEATFPDEWDFDEK